MTPHEDSIEKASFWQLVFSHSKVNGAPYYGENLLGQVWNWPQDTYLRRRLRQVRSNQYYDKASMN